MRTHWVKTALSVSTTGWGVGVEGVGVGVQEDPRDGASLTHAAKVQAAVESVLFSAYRHTQANADDCAPPTTTTPTPSNTMLRRNKNKKKESESSLALDTTMQLMLAM